MNGDSLENIELSINQLVKRLRRLCLYEMTFHSVSRIRFMLSVAEDASLHFVPFEMCLRQQ